MSGQARVKSLQAPIFKARTTAIPAKFWKALLVRSEGSEITNLLEEWGAPDISAIPATSLLVTARETTGRIVNSKLVIRGPCFTATVSNPVKANTIWPGADPAITLRFSIQGEALNFANKDARNCSLWASLDSLTSFRVYKAGDEGDVAQSPSDIKNLEGVKDGACFRVVLHPYSVSQMEATLQVIPTSLKGIREKADTWEVSAESNTLPALNLTSHWTRYGPLSPCPLSGEGPQSTDCLSPGLTLTVGRLSQPWADPHSRRTVSALG